MPSQYRTITSREYNRDRLRRLAKWKKAKFQERRERFKSVYGFDKYDGPKNKKEANQLGQHLHRLKVSKEKGWLTSKDAGTVWKALTMAVRILGPRVWKWWTTPGKPGPGYTGKNHLYDPPQSAWF